MYLLFHYILRTCVNIDTGCLKIDATHLYKNDSLLRQVQWRSFETRPVKNTFFELETSNKVSFFNLYYFSFQDTQLLKVFVSVINHYHINGLHLFCQTVLFDS